MLEVRGGSGYMASVVDGYSRKVLALKVSNRMSGEICFEAVKEAVRKYEVPIHQALEYRTPDEVYYGGRVEVFNKKNVKMWLKNRGTPYIFYYTTFL